MDIPITKVRAIFDDFDNIESEEETKYLLDSHTTQYQKFRIPVESKSFRFRSIESARNGREYTTTLKVVHSFVALWQELYWKFSFAIRVLIPVLKITLWDLGQWNLFFKIMETLMQIMFEMSVANVSRKTEAKVLNAKKAVIPMLW